MQLHDCGYVFSYVNEHDNISFNLLQILESVMMLDSINTRCNNYGRATY